MLRSAVFLDRDGTLTEPRHYPNRPEDLVLQPGVGQALHRLQSRGWAVVVVTNQSGLARGLISLQDLDDMHRHLRGLLAGHGVSLDGIYSCPHHRDGTVDGLSFPCGCRKPSPSLLLWAAEELHLDLRRSWMIGDFASDVAAGRRANCRTAWVGPAALVPPPDGSGPEPTLRAATTAAALQHVLDTADRGREIRSGAARTDRNPL